MLACYRIGFIRSGTGQVRVALTPARRRGQKGGGAVAPEAIRGRKAKWWGLLQAAFASHFSGAQETHVMIT